MNFFVTFISVFVFVTVAQCQSSKEMMKYVRECKQQTGCTEDIVKIMKKNQVPTSAEGNCAVACIMKKIGALEADNSINAETAKKILIKMHLKDDKAQTVADTCKTEVGSQTDECKAGELFTKCVMENKN